MLKYQVTCKECGHKWITSSLDPTCSECLKRNVEWLGVVEHAKPASKEKCKVKAWSCMNHDMPCGYIVFAETRSKAKSMVMDKEGFDDAEWIDTCVAVTRMKNIDGKKTESCVLNWKENARIYYEAGWFPEEGVPSCDCCGLFSYDEFPESYIKETEEGDMCEACIAQDAPTKEA